MNAEKEFDMATIADIPQPARVARDWAAQLQRLDNIKAAAEAVYASFPDGEAGTPENVMHEVLVDAISGLEYDERERLIGMPAPDLAAVKQKLELIAGDYIEVARAHASCVLADLERLGA
jgi:hypothetical protein